MAPTKDPTDRLQDKLDDLFDKVFELVQVVSAHSTHIKVLWSLLMLFISGVISYFFYTLRN